MTTCPSCGNAVPFGEQFCASCGALLDWAGQPSASRGAAGPRPAQVADQPTIVLRAVPRAAPPGRPGGPPPPPVPPRPPQPVMTPPRPHAITPTEAPSGLFCSRCGQRNAQGRSYCDRCGAPLAVGLSTAAPAPRRRRWWQRRRGPSRAAGASPAAAGRSVDAGAVRTAIDRPRFHARSHLPLSRAVPVLVVLSLLGVGLGPAREWVTTHVTGWVADVRNRVDKVDVPVTPVHAVATSAAAGHPASDVVDGVTTTAWVSGAAGDGVGSSVTISFAAPVDVDTVSVLAGLPDAAFRTLARPRTVSVSADGHPGPSLTLVDQSGRQDLHVTLTGVRNVTLTITAVYPGQTTTGGVAVREFEFSRQH